MRLYVDLRCFQDPSRVSAGVRSVGEALVRRARRCLTSVGEVVGLWDDSLPELPQALRTATDRLQSVFATLGSGGLFLQLAPLAHDADCLAGLLRRPGRFNCALVGDLPPDPAGQSRSRLNWLKHYQAFACLTPTDARRLEELLAPPPGSILPLSGPDGTTLLEELAERFWTHVGQRRQLAQAQVCARRARPRLAWLGPYPPARSGVAEHSASTVKALAEHVEVDVFTEGGGPGADLPRIPWVRKFERLGRWPYITGEYDAVVAVIANTTLHVPILEWHRRHGGPCLLHEPHLAELLTLHLGESAANELASRCARRAVPAEEFRTWLVEPSRLPVLLLDELIRRSAPLIVPNPVVHERIRRQYGGNSEAQVVGIPFCCPRRFRAEELTPEARAEARRRLGVPEERVKIVSLGMLHAAKAPLECIWVVEHLRAWGVDAELHFVGAAVFMRSSLEPWLARLELEGRVHFHHDWLEPARYRDHLLGADFALVLRSRGTGNFSEAVLDCIDADLPTVVNEDLAATMQCAELLMTVPDVFSPLLIAERILDAVESGRQRSRLGPARNRYLEEHSPDRHARALLRALEVA
jgi:glycosyltransferase involved in cell wall biosynthesis